MIATQPQFRRLACIALLALACGRPTLAIMAGVFHTCSTPSVSTGPGATALTRMPYFAHSAPRLWVSAVTPALAAA